MQEFLDIDAYFKLFLGLFAMVDPIAGAIMFLALAGPFPKAEQAKMAGVACLTMLITFGIFLLLGESVLEFFGISRGAFTTMGGIVLLLMGLDLLRTDGLHEEVSPDENQIAKKSWLGIAIVPVAIPILSGPGALTTIVIYSAEGNTVSNDIAIAVVILAVTIVTYILLRSSWIIARALGQTGISVVNKIMGMIILAIAVEFLFDGVAQHFPDLRTSNDEMHET